MKKTSQKVLTKNHQPKQFEIATLAVYLLGGASRSIDTEDAAMKCHELAPTLFSWQKYKQQINLELVRVSLSDAKKERNGMLLSGSGREGWRVTSKGMDWVGGPGRSLSKNASSLSERSSTAGSIGTVRRRRERERLKTSAGWQQWSQEGTVSLLAAKEIFRINEYTTGKMIDIKIARVRDMFEGDKELGAFVRMAALAALEGRG